MCFWHRASKRQKSKDKSPLGCPCRNLSAAPAGCWACKTNKENNQNQVWNNRRFPKSLPCQPEKLIMDGAVDFKLTVALMDYGFHLASIRYECLHTFFGPRCCMYFSMIFTHFWDPTSWRAIISLLVDNDFCNPARHLIPVLHHYGNHLTSKFHPLCCVDLLMPYFSNCIPNDPKLTP